MKCVAFVGVLLMPALAYGGDTDEMTREIERFVKAYKVRETGEISLKISMQIAKNNGKADRTFVDCMNSKLTSNIYEDVALDVARQQFNSLDNLKKINAFLESSAGRKVIDQAITWHASTLKRVLAGLEPLPPQPAQYTTREWAEIQAWGKSPAYADLKRFIDEGLRNLQSNDKAKSRLLQIKSQCST